MIRRLFFGMALLLVASPALAQESAASFAARLKPMVGHPLTGTLVLADARAEGDLLILVLDAPDWRSIDRDNVQNLFLTGFCRSGDDKGFFKVNRLRVDSLQGGEGLKTGSVISNCPAVQP